MASESRVTEERKGSVVRCLVIQHVEGEGPYAIGDALSEHSIEQQRCSVFEGEEIPRSVEDLDGLVVMGGPMSARSDEHFPTRRAEIELIERALRQEIPILGICLGAQLLASAAGGEVRRGDSGSEIGWGQVTLTKAASLDPLFAAVPRSLEVLHWHEDTMALPQDAVLLASSDRYASQAFRIGSSAWGLQFHLEVDDRAVACFVEEFGEEATEAGVDPAEILVRTPSALVELDQTKRRVTSRFATLVCDHAHRRGMA